jgi:hypothetical protein
MNASARPRPCWVVLAPGMQTAIEKAISADRTIEVREGNAGYVAIIQYERGSEGVGDEKLARRLSKGARPGVHQRHVRR